MKKLQGKSTAMETGETKREVCYKKPNKFRTQIEFSGAGE